MDVLSIEQILFLFFFFSFSGWAGETIMESVVRRRFVNKGVYKGPWVPIHGAGAFVIYHLCMPLKEYPLLVFIASTVICTIVEYMFAVLLENVFYVKGWDYTTYPFTKWCHYKGRIALTTSLFFGFVAVAIIYFYFDFGVLVTRLLGRKVLIIFDVVYITGFIFDATVTETVSVKNKLAGEPIPTVGLE